MSNLLQLQKGSKAFGSKVLFDEATFSIDQGEHVGVIGPNGAGKSTLFKAMIGQEDLDEGVFVRSNGLRVGYLAQEDQWEFDETLESYLSSCSMPIWDLKALGKGLGLEETHFNQPVRHLSGGYRMRCKLLYLLGTEPDLMLLDEPTNYLDLETLLVLEQFLIEFPNAFLVISHDREFLRRVTDHTLEVEGGDISKFPGNIDDYFEQKAMLREQLEKRAASIEAKRSAILDFARRFGAKATKARQAQSRLKSLSKLEKIEVASVPVTAKIKIPAPVRIGKKALQAKNLALGYDQKQILGGVDFVAAKGDHIAIVGVNGAGKTTLLKGIAQELSPMKGEIEYGHQVDIGYYAQHVPERLVPTDTVFDSLMGAAHSDVSQQDVLDLAGSLLFSGQDVEKPIRVLSGGEKARVALGQVLSQKVPLLVLDEPTNHLDFMTVEALTQALQSYPGTLIVVSHDRSFVSRIAKKIMEVNAGKVSIYPGTYDEYVWSVQRKQQGLEPQDKETAPRSIKSAPETEVPRKSHDYREKKKNLEREIRKNRKNGDTYEKKIEKTRAEMAALNAEMAADPNQVNKNSLDRLSSLQDDLDRFEENWMSALSDLEQLEQELKELVGS